MIQLRTVAVILFIPLLFYSFWGATPTQFTHGAIAQDANHPNSVAEMQQSAATVDRLADPDDQIFTIFPQYYIIGNNVRDDTSPRIYHLVSPQHGRLEGFNQTTYHDTARAQFIRDLRGGGLDLLVMTERLDYMLSRWPVAREAFQANWCRVQPTPQVWQEHNARGYEYAPERTDSCINHTRYNNTYD